MPDSELDNLRGERLRRVPGRVSPVRVALLFGSAAIALALFATSYLGSERWDEMAVSDPGGLDPMTTGSVRTANRYIIRKSVLQDSPDAVCIIRPNGTSSGDC
jgi:hypothetical protein